MVPETRGYAQMAGRFDGISESIMLEKRHKPILGLGPITEFYVLDIRDNRSELGLSLCQKRPPLRFFTV